MTTWFTADLHLGHRNIIGYCDRPFDGVETMNHALIARWNDVVDDGDTVYVLGDFALGAIDETLPLARELRGHLVLLTGNHDRCWTGHGRRSDGWTDRYLNAGFAEVRQDEVMIELGNTPVRLCHFPYRGDSHDRDRYATHRPVDDGHWLLHGHVHTRWGQDGRMINVGVDVTAFRPISETEITDLIADGPAHRPRLVES